MATAEAIGFGEAILTIGGRAVSGTGVNLWCESCGAHAHWSYGDLLKISPPVWNVNQSRACASCGAACSCGAIYPARARAEARAP